MRGAISLALLLISYVSYAEGARHSVLLDPVRAERRALAERVIKDGGRDDAAERRLAERYWQRYPDIAANGHFGRQGSFGIHGAREHYQRHGRHEGRLWGLE